MDPVICPIDSEAIHEEVANSGTGILERAAGGCVCSQDEAANMGATATSRCIKATHAVEALKKDCVPKTVVDTGALTVADIRIDGPTNCCSRELGNGTAAEITVDVSSAKEAAVEIRYIDAWADLV